MTKSYRFEVAQAKNDKWFWHFIAPNNEICCVSQMYTTKGHAKAGAEVLIKHAAAAQIIDLSDKHELKVHDEPFLRQWHHDNQVPSKVGELLDKQNFEE